MPQRRPTGRPSVHRRRIRAALAAALVVGVWAATAAPALADPQDPTDQQLGQAAATVQRASAEVGRLSGLVASAEAELEKLEVQAEAAGQAYDAAERALEQAQVASD